MKIPTRQEGDKEKATELILIYTEGIKTEPNYFMQFKERIHAAYRNVVSVDVDGKGKSTMHLFNAIGDDVNKKIKVRGHGRGVTVWLVYDYDGKPDFDDMQGEVEKRCGDGRGVEYRLAWSNWCVELWFTLHFQDMPEANCTKMPNCTGYKKRLSNHLGVLYRKNNDEIFDKLLDKGDPVKAIERAEKLVRLSKGMGTIPSAANPCTHVHELVKVLAQYLPEQLKARFIQVE